MEIHKIKVNGVTYDIVDKETVEAAETLLLNKIAEETERASQEENRIASNANSVREAAAKVDGNAFVVTANEVTLKTTGVDASKEHSVTLPAATITSAGVMSAEDKERLYNLQISIDEVGNKIKYLTSNDYKGLYYSPTLGFLSSQGRDYNSFVFELSSDKEFSLGASFEKYNELGISSVYTFENKPIVTDPRTGVNSHNKQIETFSDLSKYTPEDKDNYLLINIIVAKYVDNSMWLASTGVYKDLSQLDKRVTSLQTEVEDIKNGGTSNTANSLAGKTILCLGDSITEFAEPGEGGRRYSDYLENITGAKRVYNGGFGGTLIGRRVSVDDLETKFNEYKTKIENSSDAADIKATQKEATTLAYACLDLSSIAYALATGEFDIPIAGADWFANRPITTSYSQIKKYETIVNGLIGIDLNAVDIITIFMGTNNSGNYLGTVGETIDYDAIEYYTPQMTMCQGFEFAIRELLTNYPHLRIYYFSPMPRYFADLWKEIDGELVELWDNAKWCDNYKLNLSSGAYTFTELVDKAIELAKTYKIPVCDMYRTMGINQYNIRSVMGWEGKTTLLDGTHPYRGFKMIANKIASFIIANNNLNI